MTFLNLSTIASTILIWIYIAYLNTYADDQVKLILGLNVSDVKNICLGILVGLFFSFLFTIKYIRNLLLGSISNFLTHKSYIQKLNPKELKSLQNEITKMKHGVDIVTNKESLFHSIQKLDEILTVPHKSVVNEKWVIKNHGNNKLLITRTQNYRIHTLKTATKQSFNLKFRYSIQAKVEELSDIMDNFNMLIELEGSEIFNITKDNIQEYENKAIDNTSIEQAHNPQNNIYHFYFETTIKLDKEFTKIKMQTTRVEPEDDSIALVVTDATYCSNYDFELPNNITVNNIYTQETLIPSDDKQVDITKEPHSVSININGWQLPGLLFVLTFDTVKET